MSAKAENNILGWEKADLSENNADNYSKSDDSFWFENDASVNESDPPDPNDNSLAQNETKHPDSRWWENDNYECEEPNKSGEPFWWEIEQTENDTKENFAISTNDDTVLEPPKCWWENDDDDVEDDKKDVPKMTRYDSYTEDAEYDWEDNDQNEIFFGKKVRKDLKDKK